MRHISRLSRFGGSGILKIIVLIMLAVAAVLGGCSEECVPPKETYEFRLETIWPDDDGNYWVYNIVSRQWDTTPLCDSIYNSEEEVPPAPSLDEVEELLGRDHPGEPICIKFGIYKLKFAGDTTSPIGVTGRNLREKLYVESDKGTLAKVDTRMPAVVQRVLVARPDIHSKEIGLLKDYPEGDDIDLEGTIKLGDWCAVLRPLLIHGGIWERAEGWIGTYGDLDRALAWKFLESDLSIGHEFTFQLLPSLVEDVFLHCRIVGVSIVETGVGVFKNALECIYLIDYGIMAVRDQHGDPVGYCRPCGYGKVYYVPDIGPVYAYERGPASVDGSSSLDNFELTVMLIGTVTDK